MLSNRCVSLFEKGPFGEERGSAQRSIQWVRRVRITKHLVRGAASLTPMRRNTELMSLDSLRMLSPDSWSVLRADDP